MESLKNIVDKAFSEDVYKCVISNPKSKQEIYKKIEINLINDVYFVEKFTDTQVFHEQLTYSETKLFINEMLENSYRNFNSWCLDSENSIKISKKGKLLFNSNKKQNVQMPAKKTAHNKEKNYILKQGEYIEPLVDMGIFTGEGKIINSMYDKYKQINRFIEIIDDEIKNISPDRELTILDFGCGKSYLTFILYYYFTKIKNLKVKMIGLDLKKDVIEKCNKTAEKYGYTDLRFEVGNISDFDFKDKLDIVITLHACDTATDFALYNAILWNAEMIFSVPCCQHEVNSQIKSENFKILTKYGIVKERFSALLTDAIRSNLLESCGYRTQMIEFIDFENTPKNVLIRAKRTNKKLPSALLEVENIMKEFNIQPTLYRLLTTNFIDKSPTF